MLMLAGIPACPIYSRNFCGTASEKFTPVKTGVEILISAVGMGIVGADVALTICGVDEAREVHEETASTAVQSVADKQRENVGDIAPDYTIQA